MSHSKKICVTAFCLALCHILPTAFHSVGLGTAFSPIHLPVLLCGLICGWPYGIFCGIAGPLLASLSGMPSPAQLIFMVPELFTYGIVTGCLTTRVRTGRLAADLYLILPPAMIAGRAAGGLTSALLTGAGGYSLSLWVAAYFVNTFPGILFQLVTIPLIVKALEKAHLVPPRYPAENFDFS